MGLEKLVTKEFWKEHLISATSIFMISHPTFSLYEITLGNLSHKSSQFGRLEATALLLLGLGYAAERVREKSRKAFGINSNSSELIQNFHDSTYFGMLNCTVSMPMYLFANLMAGDPVVFNDIFQTSFKAGLLGVVIGYPTGWVTDIMLDATGVRESDRLYNLGQKVKNVFGEVGSFVEKVTSSYHRSSRKFKVACCALGLATSLSVTAGWYLTLPDKAETNFFQDIQLY
jgi:hypothetical protein